MISKLESYRLGRPFQIDNFPDTDDYLMVSWIGNIWKGYGGNANPEIGVCFNRIANPEDLKLCLESKTWDKSFNNTKDKFRNINISELPLVTLGSIWCKKELVQELSPENFEYNIISIMPAEKKVRKFVPIADILKPWEWNRSGFADSPCIRVSGFVDSNELDIIIPCAELARFYWGTSTSFFRDIITHGVDDLSWFLENKDVTDNNTSFEILPNKSLKVWIKHEYAEADAYSFARIVGEPEAKRQALLLNRSLQVTASQTRNSFYLQTGLPFSNGTRLYAYGKKLYRKEGPSLFFVLRLIRCFHAYPFKSIEVNKIKTEAVSGDEKINDISPTIPYNRSIETKDKEIISKADANKHKPTQRSKIFEEPFPAMAQCPLVLRYREVKSSGRTYDVFKSDSKTVSGGTGQFNDSEIAPYRKELKVNSKRLTVNEHNKEEKPRRLIQPYFELLIHAVALLKNKNFILEWSVLEAGNDRLQKYESPVLSEFPRKVNGDIYTWTKMPGQCELRQCLWIELTLAKQYMYLCEWERRDKDDFAIYLLVKAGGQQADKYDFKEIMQAWASDAKRRMTNGLDGIGWKRTSIQHFRNQEGSEAKERLADRIEKHIKHINLA